MEVHRVSFAVDRYQSLAVDDDRLLGSGLLYFDGSSRRGQWEPPMVYVPDRTLERGDFLHLWGCAVLVCSPRAAAVLARIAVKAEFLPLPLGSEELTLVNVLENANCLDEEATTWATAEDGTRLYPETYRFHPRRLPDSTLFRIPETAAAELLTHEGRLDPADEFRHATRRHALTGLLFQPLWSDDRHERPLEP